jgi:hypothetical protein
VRPIVWRFEIDPATSDRRPRLQVPGCYLARTKDDNCGRPPY